MKIETAPPVVIRPMLSPRRLVNHKAPSGPAVMPSGPLIPAPGWEVICPAT